MLTNGRKHILNACGHFLVLVVLSLVSLGQSLFVFGEQAEALGRQVLWFGIGNTLVIIAAFYINLYIFIPRFFLKHRYALYLLALLGATAFYLVMKGAAEYYMLLGVGIRRSFNAVTLLDGLSNLVLYSICVASSSAGVLFRLFAEDRRRIGKLENERLRSKVETFKSNIDTEHLYQVLDFAAERVKTNPAEASEAIFKLGDALRNELYGRKGGEG